MEGIRKNMTACIICRSENTAIVHRVDHQPLGRYGFASSAEQARAIAHDLSLQIHECNDCGFAWNATFEGKNVDYQGLPILEAASHSKAYQDYQDQSAIWLADHCDRPLRSALEIGGGSGYFLQQLAAEQKTIFEPSPEGQAIPEGIRHINRYFDASRDEVAAELVIMRQVLEHIPAPCEFIEALVARHAEGGFSAALNLYIEVPSHDQTRQAGRFYDFYYEHCNYFTLSSLARLADRCGGTLVHLSSAFNREINRVLIRFSHDQACRPYQQARETLLSLLSELRAQGQAIALWGASGNGISSLSQLKLAADSIAFVIDSDPRKQGRFIPVSGQEIVAPQDPRLQAMDCILISSQFHTAEIARQARELFQDKIRLFDLSGQELAATP